MEIPNREFMERLQKSDAIPPINMGPMSQGIDHLIPFL